MKDQHKTNVAVDSDKARAQVKIRKCLMCKRKFESSWIGERICRRCKATSVWRGG